MGKTCVPPNPQRVITLDNVGNALALGIKPVGSYIDEETRAFLKDKITGIKHVFSQGEPNLEMVLSLKPDLILGSSYQRQIYSQLSQISPTVLAEYSTNEDWKKVLMKQAEALGKTDEATQLMSDYYARLEQFKAQMGARLQQTEVSVIRIYPGSFSLYTTDGFVSTILKDIGLRYPSVHDRYPIGESVPKEGIHDIDADVIFVWSYGNSTAIAQDAQTALEQIKTDPLWLQLDAVQQGKVYEVPSYWIGDSILAAHAVIDDLCKYLVES